MNLEIKNLVLILFYHTLNKEMYTYLLKFGISKDLNKTYIY